MSSGTNLATRFRMKKIAPAFLSLLVACGAELPDTESDVDPGVGDDEALSAGQHVYVSDLTLLSVRNSWGPVERDRSNGTDAAGDGGPLRLAGQTYAKGLGVRGYFEATVALDGKYTRFHSAVGVDDE